MKKNANLNQFRYNNFIKFYWLINVDHHVKTENRFPMMTGENQGGRTKLKTAISSGIQLGTRNSLLIKNNESFSERVCQLEDEVRELKNQITHKDISLASARSEIAIKLEEIQALQLRVEELKQDASLAQEELSKIDSLKRKLELENADLTNKNIELDWAKSDLEDILTEKKDKLIQIKDDLLSAQKAVIEKDSLLQETNTLLLEQILKTSSESKQNEVIGGDKGLKKGNEITSSETTSESPYSLFFQHAIIFVIVLLIIYILWCVFSRLYSSYNKEKNILNYKIPLNRNQGYAFLI